MAISLLDPDRPRYRSAITGLNIVHWVFLFFVAALVGYAVLQSAVLVLQPPDFEFDYFLLINAALFLPVVWRGARIQQWINEVFVSLRQAGNVVFESDEVGQRVITGIERRCRLIGLGLGGLVSASVAFGNIQYYDLFIGGRLDWESGFLILADGRPFKAIWEFLTLVGLLTVASFIAGFVLGEMIGIGGILGYLRRRGYSLSGFASDRGTVSLRRIERIFEYAVFCTTAICVVVFGWWLVWNATPFSGFNNYEMLFLALGAVGYLSFLIAGYLPVRQFDRSLDALYGAAEGRALVSTHLQLARADLGRLADRTEEALGDEFDRIEQQKKDLMAYINSLESRDFNKILLRPLVITLLLAFNTVAFAVPWIWLALGPSGAGIVGSS